MNLKLACLLIFCLLPFHALRAQTEQQKKTMAVLNKASERLMQGDITALHLWIEPAIVFVAATALRGFMAEHRLSFWLLMVVGAMWLKEFINYWYGLRSEKKHGDIMDDAMEKMPAGSSAAASAPPGAGGRKARPKRPPNSADAGQVT